MNAANGVNDYYQKRKEKVKPVLIATVSFTAIFPTSMMKVMNAAQYAEISNELSMNAGSGPTTTPEELAKWQAGGPAMEKYRLVGCCIQKKVQVANNILFLLRVVCDKMTYYASFGYAHDGDLTRGGDFNYERYTMRSNFTAQLSKVSQSGS